jgi:hypothetical protein
VFAGVWLKSWIEEGGKTRASSVVDWLLGIWLSSLSERRTTGCHVEKYLFFFFSSINPDSPVKHKFSLQS